MTGGTVAASTGRSMLPLLPLLLLLLSSRCARAQAGMGHDGYCCRPVVCTSVFSHSALAACVHTKTQSTDWLCSHGHRALLATFTLVLLASHTITDRQLCCSLGGYGNTDSQDNIDIVLPEVWLAVFMHGIDSFFGNIKELIPSTAHEVIER